MKKFIAFIITAVMALSLASCALMGGSGTYEYADADLYVQGGAEVNLDAAATENVTALDVDWVAGEIKIVDGDAFTMTEECAEGDYTPLYYYVGGDTLYIKSAVSGTSNDTLKKSPKKLTVTVPEGVVKFTVNTTKADYSVKSERIAAVIAETVTGSGFIDCEYLTGAVVTSVSGNVEMKAKAELVIGIVVVTVSGNAQLTIDNVDDINLEFQSISGKIVSDFEALNELNSATSVSASEEQSAESSGDEPEYYEFNGKQYLRFTVHFNSVSGNLIVKQAE
ncbi:MAG: hypothetical protein J5762_03315 [Clostridia bacterium]|nr:hypothetical protein [Clostridia bacterium]